MQKNNNCKTVKNSSIDEVPITPEEYNNILNIQNTILQMIASHTTRSDTLVKLCKMAEGLLPNSVASIMLKNETSGLMSVLHAPSVPEVGHQALKNLKPGPTGGSCGNAVFHNEAQYVRDTFTDCRWEDLRQVAYDFNLCSCWSMPVRDKNKKAIGTFALSSFEHRSPAAFHKKLLEMATSIVSIVLQNKEDEDRLKLLSASMQNATEGMIITDAENKIIEVNAAFTNMYGYKEEEILGKNPGYLSADKHANEFYENMWESLEKGSQWSDEIINKKANGEEIVQWLSISHIELDGEFSKHNYLGIFTDLTELRETQKKLEEVAFTDSLTKLPNKTELEKVLQENKFHILLLLNINNFSYINTAYGLDLGDKLLVKVAEIFEEKCSHDNVYRINSDEFAIFIDETLNIKEEVKKIKSYFYNTPLTIDGINLNISFTYGSAHGNENLLRNAASALKIAKQRGKNTLHIFDSDRASVQDRKSFIESNTLLYNALNEDRIIPYYQGIRNNLSKRIEKFEVLVRIENGEEIVSPNRFLEPARLSGVLPEITKIIIDKSFKEMATNDYSFSINITEDDLIRDYLVSYLAHKSAEYGVKPTRVTLEILEGVSAHGKRSHIHQLTLLKAQGYSLAIDDFGSEYSNFERVLELDIDFLKIDARYIKDICRNKKSYEITKAIVFFAKNVGIPCIAEFVHAKKVQVIMDELGIEFSQGYHFSKPQKKPLV